MQTSIVNELQHSLDSSVMAHVTTAQERMCWKDSEIAQFGDRSICLDRKEELLAHFWVRSGCEKRRVATDARSLSHPGSID